jgi:hypothetical protein
VADSSAKTVEEKMSNAINSREIINFLPYLFKVIYKERNIKR